MYDWLAIFGFIVRSNILQNRRRHFRINNVSTLPELIAEAREAVGPAPLATERLEQEFHERHDLEAAFVLSLLESLHRTRAVALASLDALDELMSCKFVFIATGSLSKAYERSVATLAAALEDEK